MMTAKEIICKLNSESLSVKEFKSLLDELTIYAQSILDKRDITVCINLATDLQDFISAEELATLMLNENSEYPSRAIHALIEEKIGKSIGDSAWYEYEIVKD